MVGHSSTDPGFNSWRVKLNPSDGLVFDATF
jgi:hypothetical protein